MLIAEAAPLIAPAAIGGALLELAIIFCVLWALKVAYDYTFGAFLRVLASAIHKVRFVGPILSNKIDALNHIVQNAIATGLDDTEKAMGLVWGSLAVSVRMTGDAIADFGQDVHDGIAGIVHGEIPAQVRAGTKPVDQRLDKVNRRTNTAERAERVARTRGIDAVNRDLLRERLAREHGIDRVETIVSNRVGALADRLGGAIARERSYAHRILHGELTDWRALTGYAAITGIALATLTRAFPWWRCTNVRNFNRNLCRSRIGSLDWLFALAGLAVVALDPEEIAREGQELADVLGFLWDEIVS